MRTEAMDFYWMRSGLRWVVMSEERIEGDCDWGHRKTLFTCWREKTAARVCQLIFEAYGLGCDVGRYRARILSRIPQGHGAGEMTTTWQELLDHFQQVRKAHYRNDVDYHVAVSDASERILVAMLAKLAAEAIPAVVGGVGKSDA